MSTQSQLQYLCDDEWYGALADEILALHRDLGSPEPGDGPSVRAFAPYSPVSAADMGDWGGHEGTAAQAFNDGLDTLFSALDVRSCGGGQFVTTAADQFCRVPADPEWQEFREASADLVADWIRRDAFAEFCDCDPYDIGS